MLFSLLCCASKGFMKALKAFIKPFEAHQRSLKIKIWVNFLLLFEIGTGSVNITMEGKIIDNVHYFWNFKVLELITNTFITLISFGVNTFTFETSKQCVQYFLTLELWAELYKCIKSLINTQKITPHLWVYLY